MLPLVPLAFHCRWLQQRLRKPQPAIRALSVLIGVKPNSRLLRCGMTRLGNHERSAKTPARAKAALSQNQESHGPQRPPALSPATARGGAAIPLQYRRWEKVPRAAERIERVVPGFPALVRQASVAPHQRRHSPPLRQFTVTGICRSGAGTRTGIALFVSARHRWQARRVGHGVVQRCGLGRRRALAGPIKA